MTLLFTYKSSNVYQEDLGLLRGSEWINDELLGFAFDYLQHERHKEAKHPCRFVHPGTTYVIQHDDDPTSIAETVEGCDITSTYRLALFPVNDKADVTGTGGSHWSLLAFDFMAKRFFVIDSFGKSNLSHAKQLANRLCPFLLPVKYADEAKNVISRHVLSDDDLVVLDCPQQTNCYDCGFYVIAFADWLGAAVNRFDDLCHATAKSDLSKTITPAEVSSFRAAVGQWIEAVKKEKENTSSRKG